MHYILVMRNVIFGGVLSPEAEKMLQRILKDKLIDVEGLFLYDTS